MARFQDAEEIDSKRLADKAKSRDVGFFSNPSFLTLFIGSCVDGERLFGFCKMINPDEIPESSLLSWMLNLFCFYFR